MKKISLCIGTRPEAIKLAPIALKLREEGCFEVSICLTGQHIDMVTEVLDIFQIVPDINFMVMNKASQLNNITSILMSEFENYFNEFVPDIVIGQGDTTTAFTAALSAYYKKIKFAHIEAGLRTGDIYSPWPEEGNRKMITAITEYHFAPTIANKNNLIHEGVLEDRIYITGNTVIDALLIAEKKIEHLKKQDLGLPIELFNLEEDKRMVLITGHRRENLGAGFEGIFSAINDLAEKYKDVNFVFPVHLNPNVRRQVDTILRSKNQKNVILTNPISYLQFIWLLKKSYFILSDSGGIQEEAPSFGKPVLVTRKTTERPEGVDAGCVRVIGTDYESVYNNCERLLRSESEYLMMIKKQNPYGNGDASQKIVDVLKNIEI